MFHIKWLNKLWEVPAAIRTKLRGVRPLTLHLSAVSHYESKQLADKVVKHLKSFKPLLEYGLKNALISKDAYNTLMMNTDALIEKWE
ncbi:FIMAH domain-containing protein [Virgibacillus dakarensis]|uniref:FIMAH domain-containing protein n=1 Tax=Virgibacillus dakarensis TaxID=1917889 RepID=UPI000B431E3A|nr:hypothetical protein [Virgibacillus dakarensis]